MIHQSGKFVGTVAFKLSNRANNDLYVFRETLRTIFNSLNRKTIWKHLLQNHDRHKFLYFRIIYMFMRHGVGERELLRFYS